MFCFQVQQPFGRTNVPICEANTFGGGGNFWQQVRVWWEDFTFHDAIGRLLPRLREILAWGLNRAAVWLAQQVLNWLWPVPALGYWDVALLADARDVLVQIDWTSRTKADGVWTDMPLALPRFEDGNGESVEAIAGSVSDHLLHNRIKELGLQLRTEELLSGDWVDGPQ